jgi:hypothetical protein
MYSAQVLDELLYVPYLNYQLIFSISCSLGHKYWFMCDE